MGPDNAAICRFRSRLGAERSVPPNAGFNRIVAQARAQKLVSDRLHAVDATAVQSKVNTWRWRDGGGKDDDPRSGGGGGGLEKWEGPCLGSGPARDGGEPEADGVPDERTMR